MNFPSERISHLVVPILQELQYHIRKHYYLTVFAHHPMVSEINPYQEVEIDDKGVFSDFVNAPEVETIAVLSIISW